MFCRQFFFLKYLLNCSQDYRKSKKDISFFTLLPMKCLHTRTLFDCDKITTNLYLESGGGKEGFPKWLEIVIRTKYPHRFVIIVWESCDVLFNVLWNHTHTHNPVVNKSFQSDILEIKSNCLGKCKSNPNWKILNFNFHFKKFINYLNFNYIEFLFSNIFLKKLFKEFFKKNFK